MPFLKKDASAELIEAVGNIEERADACFGSLMILKLNSNVAVWSLLVGSIKLVEEEIAARGDNTPQFDAMLRNVSHFTPVAMKWAREHGRPASKLASRRWSRVLADRVAEALDIAFHFNAFLTCFPMWHKGRYAAELISPIRVRFTVLGSVRDRQVSAYLKGFRPKEGRYKGQRATKPEQTRQVQELFSEVFKVCRKTGMRRFEYDDPWLLWMELLPEYQARVASIVRRADLLSLGNYTLKDFKQFYAALLAVCATHEFLCFTWAKNYGLYPFDSSVMVKSPANWVAILSKLSSVSGEKCGPMVRDLTFDFSRSLNFHVHPFVPLDPRNAYLALAPQFPLHSRPDENILRVCSLLRPSVFDSTSLKKEAESLASLQKQCSQYSLQGPLPLPKPNPDIDLIVTDHKSSTIVIAELKWIRKTERPTQIEDRNVDVSKGIGQLKQIRQFLIDNPGYLRAQGKLPKRMSEYENVFFLLVARDHWLWVEPVGDIAIVEYEAFVAALNRCENLHSAVIDLLRYEWLPVEGRDFTVRYDAATVNGVSMEGQVFYPM